MDRFWYVLMISSTDGVFTVTVLMTNEFFRSPLAMSAFDMKLLVLLLKWVVLNDFLKTLLHLELVVLTEIPVVLLWEFSVVSYGTYHALLRTMHRIVFL